MDYPFNQSSQQYTPQQQPFGGQQNPNFRDAGVHQPHQQQFQYASGATPRSSGAGTGGVMQAGGPQQFNTPVPYPDGTPTPQRSTSYTHNSNANSPHNMNSPSNGIPQMGTPPQNLGPGQQQNVATNNATSQPTSGAVQSPTMATTSQTPEQLAKERERCSLLLSINQILLQEIIKMQESGKGGDIQTPPNAKPGEEKKDSEKAQASKDFVDFMRRMQANLAYLANVAEQPKKPQSPNLQWPPIMNVPTAGPPALAEMYTKLLTLFPGYKPPQQQVRPAVPQASG